MRQSPISQGRPLPDDDDDRELHPTEVTQFYLAFLIMGLFFLIGTQIVDMNLNKNINDEQTQQIEDLQHRVDSQFKSLYTLRWALKYRCDKCPRRETQNVAATFFYPSTTPADHTVLQLANNLEWNETCIDKFWTQMNIHPHHILNHRLGLYTTPDGLSYEFKVNDFYKCTVINTSEDDGCSHVPQDLITRSTREYLCT